MEKPTIDKLIGVWEMDKMIDSEGNQVESIRPDKWELFDTGNANYYYGDGGQGQIMDLKKRTWSISEQPNKDGNYALLINDTPLKTILQIEANTLVTRSHNSEVGFTYYKRA